MILLALLLLRTLLNFHKFVWVKYILFNNTKYIQSLIAKTAKEKYFDIFANNCKWINGRYWFGIRFTDTIFN